MNEQSSSSPSFRHIRTFAAGGVVGLLVGAFLMAAMVWRFGNVVGSRDAGVEHPADVPSAMDRWSDGGSGHGEAAAHPGEAAVRRGEVAVRPHEPEGPVATGGMGPVPPTPPPPAASPKPTIAASPAAELADRDLAIPVEGISPERLVRSFAEARGSRLHEAIDILAPRNTPVLAVEDGTIARLFYSEAGGITIYQFDPTERYCYYYAHLERYADGLAEGQSVQKGQVIGYVGVSGNAPQDTPHLHFAIYRLSPEKRWWEGTPIDPFDALSQADAAPVGR